MLLYLLILFVCCCFPLYCDAQYGSSYSNNYFLNYDRNYENNLLNYERINKTINDLSYGLLITDKKRIPRGPKFTHEPKAAVFDVSGRSQQNYISLRCEADAYPTPTYTWFKEEHLSNNEIRSRLINPLDDNRFTQTDGTLTIYNPQQQTDRGKYHCKAQNEFGMIVSQTIQISFGFIGEFNRKRSNDIGKANWGKSISCDAPHHHPTVNYYWVKNSFPSFVEEDQRVFVSKDANLYFSSLEIIDQANYSCNVQSVISSTGRTGPFFSLIVEPSPNNQKLLFPNNFPKAFPEAPLVGQQVRLECLAFGYPVPYYNWTRRAIIDHRELPLPYNSNLINHNRVLEISNVQLEDVGDYVCTAISGRDIISKSVTLSIQSLPIFTKPIKDMVIDVNSRLEWQCEAIGIPSVQYSWYRNGEPLILQNLPQEDQMRYRIIKENVLVIEALNPSRDNACFQCKASNQLGSTFSTAQLKIMSLKPVFKHKMDKDMFASTGNNFTIPCDPEAVPFPEFQWKKNNMPLNLGGKFRILPNGHLFINPINLTDEGDYTCIVTNEHGFAQDSTFLTIFEELHIIKQPTPKIVALTNDAIELPCKAHTGNELDIAYVWLHNNVRINYTIQQQFSVGYEPGYLRINNITFAEAGVYTCLIKTSIGQNFANTELIVNGPPNRCGAVLAEDITATSAKIMWTDGSNNGRNIIAYNIEGRTNHNQNWRTIARYVTNFQLDTTTNRKYAILRNVLSPWSTYEFRVSAINDLGVGAPSDSSPLYNTDKERPFGYPNNISGGGGKTGSLTITWEPLHPQHWHASSIWYKIYYKPAHSKQPEFFEKELSTMGNIGMYTIGINEEDYYTEYYVKVQAINSVGAGPESPVVSVYSAESMPQIQPSLVRAEPFNSTALKITWAPIEQTREKVRGKLVGHRIKYWRNGKDPQTDALTLLNRGAQNNGMIVALTPNTEYYVSVMIYNEAGSGPESEPALSRTYKAAPQRPPVNVHVDSVDSTTIRVTWRGVSVTSNEEPIIGYKVRYWQTDQPAITAKEAYKYLDGQDLEAIISGLIPGKPYKLRVLAYSLGGDGKMSNQWEFINN